MDKNQNRDRTSAHICSDETLSDLATAAAVNALKSANIDASQLDLIICLPFGVIIILLHFLVFVQSRINATCPAFDVNAACSQAFVLRRYSSLIFLQRKLKKYLLYQQEKMSSMLTGRTVLPVYFW
jgi:3-oxoacyl-[acyl-carrier-protein] synthase-3